MPSHHALHDSPWWSEFVAIKDDHGWAMLSKRYGVAEPNLREALDAAGLTKAAAKAGRRKASEALPPALGVVAPAPPWEKWKDRLGKEPDGVLARAAGVTADTIKGWRRELKIAAFHKAPPAPPEAAPVAPPAEPPKPRARVVRRRTREDGTREDTVVQEEVRVAPVVEAPKSPANPLDAFRDRMGVEADGVIAAEAGVDRRAVVKYRQERNIPAYSGFRFKKTDGGKPKAPPARTKAAPPPPPPASRAGGRRSPIDEYADKLGVLPDAEVAVLAGTSPAAVLQYRRRRGIGPAPQRPRTQKVTVDAAPVAPVAPPVVEAAPEPTRRGRRAKAAPVAEVATPVAEPAVAPVVETVAQVASEPAPAAPAAPVAPAPAAAGAWEIGRAHV